MQGKRNETDLRISHAHTYAQVNRIVQMFLNMRHSRNVGLQVDYEHWHAQKPKFLNDLIIRHCIALRIYFNPIFTPRTLTKPTGAI
jgi:hypothetical protein